MGRRYLGGAVAIGLLSMVAVLSTTSTTSAQQPGITNPAAPRRAQPITPTPNLNPSPIDSATAPGAGSQNLRTQPANSTRRRSSTSTVSSSSSSNRNNSPFSPRLARAPFVLGDSIAPSLVFQDDLGYEHHELPLGGGATRSKIAENSSSLPMDRIIFNYNHFHNAINENFVESSNIDRFTLGLEKTFLDQMASVEVRFPFSVDNDFVIPGDFARNGSDAGNLSVTLKGVLTSDRDSLLAAGLTVDTPTGGGSVLTNFALADTLTVDISNDAVHLAPFLGFLCAPGNGKTHQAFIQVDVPTNGNGVIFSDSGGSNSTELLEQTLLYIDYQFAKEFYRAGRRNRGSCVRRMLGMAEIHYTTTLEDADVVQSGPPLNNTLFEVSSAGNRLDVVNLTLGVQTDLANGSQLRVGTVAPITDEHDRFFDFEFQAQLNILFR